MSEFPVSASGKVDRQALAFGAPKPIQEQLPPSSSSSAAEGRRPPLVDPRNDTERRLKEIWAGVLGFGGFGVMALLHVGGSSIHLLRMAYRVKNAFGGQRVPLEVLQERDTIASLAMWLVAQKGDDKHSRLRLLLVVVAGHRDEPDTKAALHASTVLLNDTGSMPPPSSWRR